jgi:hypothetical protein
MRWPVRLLARLAFAAISANPVTGHDAPGGNVQLPAQLAGPAERDMPGRIFAPQISLRGPSRSLRNADISVKAA